MTHREHFFSVLEGKKPDRMPFFPDITDWYIAGRTPPGEPRRFAPGAFIPDDDEIHEFAGTIPAEFRDWTLLDFYRRFDWGCPVHLYGWCDVEYADGVSRTVEIEGNHRITRLLTPKGELTKREQMAEDGSWAPREHFVKSLGDLDLVRLVVAATRYMPRFERIERVLRELGGQGVGDVVIHRSPFGKLVHEYMGFEAVIYALADDRANVEDFLRLQEAKDLELIRIAAAAPARIVILSDHADETLISPRQYAEFCVPYYRKMNAILHAAVAPAEAEGNATGRRRGKIVSTHLDGNFKGLFPLLGETGFDLLDGCTPAPMFNYEVEELAAAMPEGMCAYCGVPAVFFCPESGVPASEVIAFGRRIQTALRGRGILNVGDILPPNGEIGRVVALGKAMSG